MAAEAAEVREDGDGGVREDGRNASLVVCRHCGSKILLPGAAQMSDGETEVFLPSVTFDKREAGDPAAKGDTYTRLWMVTDRMAFENVGVSRPVEAGAPVQRESDASFRYLTCADCERGPLGAVPDLGNRAGEHYYIAPDRVRFVPA